MSSSTSPAPLEPLAPDSSNIVPLKQPDAKLKKVTFGKIGKTATAAPASKYPAFAGTPEQVKEASDLAANIIRNQETFDAAEGALKSDKQQLRELVAPFYFNHSAGKAEVPSSISVASPEGEALVAFVAKYKNASEDAITPILGDSVALHFRQTFEIKIDGDKIPVDKAQVLVDKLQELFAEHGALDSLSMSEKLKPKDDFHAGRHLRLTAEQNIQLQAACPCEIHVKTKGRKKA